MRHVFRNRLFMAVSLGHTTIDIFNSSGPVLFAFLSVPLGLSNAQIGLAGSLYAFGSALTQPIFGWFGDRYGNRWLAGLGVAWTVIFMVISTFLVATGEFLWVLIPFALASLGSAAFHPSGTASASGSTVEYTATATALFFLFGQTGLAGGPLLSGFLLNQVGLVGLQVLALIVIPVVFFMLTTTYPLPEPLVAIPVPPATDFPSTAVMSHSPKPVVSKPPVAWGAIAPLAFLTMARAWAQLGTITFIPKLFQDKGWAPTSYGAITGTMWFASAVMGVWAGNWADRYGRRQVILVCLIAAALPLYFLPNSDGWLAFVLALLAGGLAGAPHSITVVIAQSLLPGRKTMAAGLTLGFIFGSGALASLIIGQLADLWTLPQAMQLGAGMAILGGLLAITLPKTSV